MSSRWPAGARRVAAVVFAAAALGSCHSNPAGPNPGPTPAFIVVGKPALLLTPRDTTQLVVSVLDKDSALIAGVTVTFASSDTSLVQVTAAGVVNSRTKIGFGQLTVSSGSLHSTIPVQVAGSPVVIVAAPADTTIREGASFQYRFRVVDSLGDSIRFLPATTFQYADSVGVTVSAGGVLTGRSGGPNSVRMFNGAVSSGFLTVTVTDTNVISRVALGGAPYGVAATASGHVYVAPIVGTAIHRIALPAGTLADSATVSGGDPAQIVFNGAGDTAFVTKRASGALAIVPIASGAQSDSAVIPADPYAVALGSSGDAYVGTANGGWLYRVNLSNRTRVDSLGVSGAVFHMAMGVGDSLVYVGLQSSGQVAEVRTSPLGVRRTFTTPGKVQALAVSADGAELYVGNESGAFRIINLGSGTQSDSIITQGGSFGVTLSSDGATLVVTTVTGYVYFFNRASRALKHRVYVGGILRLVRIDPVTGLAVVANEGSGEVDVVR